MKIHPYFFFKVLSKEQIIDFTKKIETKLLNNAKDIPSSHATKTASVKVVDGVELWEVSAMLNLINNANLRNFGYDLYSIRNTNFHYNTYDAANQGEYGWHIDDDTDNPVSDSKLTGIVNLSLDNFEGGELFINPFGTPIPLVELKDPGTLVVFPSRYLHKVTPVTKGTRHTGSFWVEGPRFR